jgi:hypothetical protein
MQLFRPDGQVTPGATVSPSIHGFGAQAIDVPVDSLDHYFRHHSGQPIRLIKCDVEGHELEVLRGCRRIMAEDRPLLLVECQDTLNQAGIESVFGYLQQYGYDGFFFQGQHLTSIQQLRESHRDMHHRDFVYNYVFAHRQASGQLRRAA